jgi:hypothetical protein
MINAVLGQRHVLYRLALVSSITCTALLAFSGVLSLLFFMLEADIGGYALLFLLLLGGIYLLPLGGLAFGTLSLLAAPQPGERRIATYAMLACAALSGVMFGLFEYFPVYRE